MANFFINRPVFAWVVAILIMLVGAIALKSLPVEQYPDIAPPSVTVSAYYTGADAQTVENTVTQIIEQSLTGLDNLMYMSSSSSSTGSIQVELTFETGTDPDIAQVQVLNKVESAKIRLPQAVQTNGLTVAKQNSNFLKVLSFFSEDNSMTQEQIADYISSNIKDEIGRLNGVGDTMLFGAEYAMRIWVNPNKLLEYSLSIDEVIAAIKAQNAQVTAGELGGTPSIEGQQLNATITAQTRLNTPAQFEKIFVKVRTDGSQVLLKDVARIELGSESYSFKTHYNGKPAAGLGVYLGSGANQLDTATLVDQKLEELSVNFPTGLAYASPFDTTPFVKLSIENVVHTLIEAIFLVVIVMFLFLQNFRATLIPTITVPVVLLGTFGVLFILGYSVNTLSMFAMILAIGLLVDDSIVVVENVERLIEEEHLSPKDAAIKSMEQITGALFGIGIVLSAVFLPMAFFGGATGGIFKQFAITISVSMGLSVFVAIVITPMLCATILKPKDPNKKQGFFFRGFNSIFEASGNAYQKSVLHILKRPFRFVIIYIVICVFLVLQFNKIPKSFLPAEDQGVLMAMIQLPTGSTQEQTADILEQISTHIMSNESAVDSIFTINGFGLTGRGQSSGMAFLKLKDYEERNKSGDSIDSIIQRVQGFLSTFKDTTAFAFNVPAIPSLGMSDGFSMVIQDVGGNGHEALMAAMFQTLKQASEDPRLQAVRPGGLLDVPQFKIDVDFEKTQVLGLSLNNVNSTLSTMLGSAYIDDFVYDTRVKKVYMQGDAPYRMNPSDLNYWYVKNAQGQMVPFSSFAKTNWSYGSPQLSRYNGYSSFKLEGSAAPGYSSGEAMNIMEEISKNLPEGFAIDWTDISFQERQSGGNSLSLYGFSLIVVFLALAALYESWSIPISVLFVIPLGVIGTWLATYFRGLDNDVYFQVALVTTMGLAAKNAILIIEFAEDAIKKEGKSLVDATLEACRLRLRPILMTSFAFIFGVLPLAVSTGAGAASQHAVGTGVIGGMLSATTLALFYVPLFFYLIARFFTNQGQLHNHPKEENNENQQSIKENEKILNNETDKNVKIEPSLTMNHSQNDLDKE